MILMKQWVCGWALCVGLLPLPGAWAQTPTATLIEPPAPLLPTSDRLVVDDAAAAVPPETPEMTAVLAEDGLKRTETRAVKSGGAAAGWVRAYQFGDATGAFSAYTYFRQGGRPSPVWLGSISETRLPGDELVLLSGVSVLRAHLKDSPEAVTALLSRIQIGLPKVGGPRGLSPLLPTLFPKQGLDAASIRYALGPAAYQQMGGLLPAAILGWDKSAEVATATYSGKAGHGTLTLFMYPTPQIAGERGRAMEQAINQRGQAAFGTVRLKRLGPLVEMTAGDFTPQQALTLVEAVHLNDEITFDKRMPLEFHAEIRKTYTLLQSIAAFVGLGILAALVLGVFLGGARAGIRVLQGKPAASEPEFLTIDLRGRPLPLKPLHATEQEGERG
jgi:hypothetical protein